MDRSSLREWVPQQRTHHSAAAGEQESRAANSSGIASRPRARVCCSGLRIWLRYEHTLEKTSGSHLEMLAHWRRVNATGAELLPNSGGLSEFAIAPYYLSPADDSIRRRN